MVVIIAILALLLGLIIGGIYNLVSDCNDDYDHMGIFDNSHGHKFPTGPVLLSEVNPHTSSGGHNHKPPIVDPRAEPYPLVMID